MHMREDTLRILHRRPAVQVKSSSSVVAVARRLRRFLLTHSRWRLKPHDLALSASFTVGTAVKSSATHFSLHKRLLVIHNRPHLNSLSRMK